jgi:predicted lipid-binding transport protein (Tim44 family)
MRILHPLAATVLAVMLVLAPGLAFARAGSGGSMGSRGSFTYSAPPSTATAPGFAAPMQRSMTAPTPSYNTPSYGTSPSYGFGNRSPFMSGLMGGLLGAGIGGLLFGGGLFHGITGFGGFLGFLFQIFLIVMIGRWLFRIFFGGQPALAGMSGLFNRTGVPGGGPVPMGGGGGGGVPQRPGVTPISVQPADFQAFERNLKSVQAAWSMHDLNGLRALSTPEMLSYFNEQLSDQASRGVVNTVTDVRLEQGDLSQAWGEQGREYATVAMRFSMIDVTRDRTERVVDGSPTERQMATELWTFVRSPGGQWVLSAIQQTR